MQGIKVSCLINVLNFSSLFHFKKKIIKVLLSHDSCLVRSYISFLVFYTSNKLMCGGLHIERSVVGVFGID